MNLNCLFLRQLKVFEFGALSRKGLLHLRFSCVVNVFLHLQNNNIAVVSLLLMHRTWH